jgi:hypothetical protein
MMYGGWWFMPLFGIVFMVLCIYMFSRFFGATGNMCAKNNQPGEMHDIFAELRREIHELRMEIKEIRNQNEKNNAKKEDT